MRRHTPRREKSFRECPSAKVEAYAAKREPHCNNGRGCTACWAKFMRLNQLPHTTGDTTYAVH